VSATFNILIVSPDGKLSAEIADAVEPLDDIHAVTLTATEQRQAVEIARSRAPELAIIEMTSDVQALQSLTREIEVVSVATAVAAAFRVDVFGDDVSESAVLIEAMRAGVRDFLRRPVSAAELRALIDRLHRSSVRAPAALGRIVSFVSNKGGVGKSTMAVNVATGLAMRHPDRVLLVDASLQMGVCASMLDLQPQTTITDAVHEQGRLDTTLLRRLTVRHECGLHLLAAPDNAVEAAEVDDDVMSRILNLARSCYDYVIVDTFPMFDRVVVAILDMSDRAYVITESVVPVLQGGVKLLELLDRLGCPRDQLGIVLSRYAKVPGGLKPGEVAERLGRPVDHVIPYDRNCLVAANMGQPNVLRGPGSWFGGFVRGMRPLVREIEQLASPFAERNGNASGSPPTSTRRRLSDADPLSNEMEDQRK